MAQLRAGRLGRRLAQLYAGLVLYGASLAMMVRGDLGLAPWDVLHSGLAARSPLTLGQVLIVVSFLVLLLWIPLREVPGLGTISNAVVVGLAADAVLAVLVTPGRAVAAGDADGRGRGAQRGGDRALHRLAAGPRARATA